jgi:peptidoglycan/xylan/chitin deacetylase (PgdA/CDA1 family)
MSAEAKPIPARSANAQARGGLFSARFRGRCRKAIEGGMYHSGMLRVIKPLESLLDVQRSSFRRSSRSKFGILCYHRVGTHGVPFHSQLAPGLFESHMRYVKKRYRVVPLAQLVGEMQTSCDVPPTLAITFDDGYRDLYLYAFPVLQKYGIPATIYLIGRCMETGEAPWYDRIFAALVTFSGTSLELEAGGARRFFLETLEARLAVAWEIVCYLRSIPETARQRWCADFDRRMSSPAELLERRMLDWNQVRAMQAAGIFFGAHTMNHPSVSQLDPAAYKHELLDSKKLLETGLDARVEDFAYPFGKLTDGNKTSQDYIASVGYRSAVTTILGFNSQDVDPFTLRRMQIGDECPMSTFACNLSRLFLEASEENLPAWSREAAVPSPIARDSEPSLP